LSSIAREGGGREVARQQRSKVALLLTLGKSDKFAWSEFEQPIRLARRAKTREDFRNEK